MELLVARYPNATGDVGATLAQAARELLLLESSDWPFLVTTGQAGEYATRRFKAHAKRFDRLTNLLKQDATATTAGKHLRARIEQLDNPFPHLDYRLFEDRGPANAYLGPIGPGAPTPHTPTSDQAWGERPIGPGAPSTARSWGSDYLWHSSAARSNE